MSILYNIVIENKTITSFSNVSLPQGCWYPLTTVDGKEHGLRYIQIHRKMSRIRKYFSSRYQHLSSHFLFYNPISLNTPSGPDTKAAEEFLVPLSSSDDSTGSSWCQLANEEDNPDDTSSYLQLSERSMRYLPILSSPRGVITSLNVLIVVCSG